jgi:uncharacterized protein (DUF924 family)
MATTRRLIDDLEEDAEIIRGAVPVTGATERQDWLRRYNAPPDLVHYRETDPYSPAYARPSIEETAGTILHFWFDYAADRPALLEERNKMWFRGGFELDRTIAHRFSGIVAKLASGEARRWAQRSARHRLAAIIALDQFSRNIFRGSAAAFENDPLALALCKEAILAGEDMALKPVERIFLYLPLEHSESASDQRRSLEKYAALAEAAPPGTEAILASTLDYAKRHAAIIRRFGRYPHRNAALGRLTTSAERAFLERPGSRF